MNTEQPSCSTPSGAPRPITATPSAYAYPLLLKQLLHSPLHSAPGQEIVSGDMRYDYTTLAQRIGRLANALTQAGVRAGDTVGVLDWDSHRYLESYFAVPGMGAILHMVNVRLSPEQILYTINHAQDDALLVHADFLPLLEGIWDRIETARTIILLLDGGDAPATTLPVHGTYEKLLTQASPDFDFPDFDENTRATTFYTTGTTGLPKGVFFSHRQLVVHTMSLATALGTSPDKGRLHRADIYMPITPMFHVHAWGVPFVATMLGLRQIYPGRYDPETLLKLIASEGVTFSHCVPTILNMLLTHPASQSVDLSNWKVIIGGSALSKGLAKAALDRGIDVFTGYGMSETCPILTLSSLTPAVAARGFDAELAVRTRAGAPVPLVDLRVADHDMHFLAKDGRQAGEVVARAPWLTQGYFRDPVASEALWHGGYLHTNDVGVIDGDGNLTITDRTKDVIKTGGEWVSSIQIEDLLSQHPGVAEAAVIATPDEKWGERPLAIVVARPDFRDSLSAAGLRDHLQPFCDAGIISKYAIPQNFLIVESLEKTSVGKLDKKAMRQRYATPGDAVGTGNHK